MFKYFKITRLQCIYEILYTYVLLYISGEHIFLMLDGVGGIKKYPNPPHVSTPLIYSLYCIISKQKNLTS